MRSLLLLFILVLAGFSLNHVLGYMGDYNDNGHGYLKKLNQTMPNNAPVPAPSQGCNQPEYGSAQSELASAEQSYQDLKSKYYQDWKQLNALGKYNGTWDDYAKEYFLTSQDVAKIKQIHEKYGGFVQYCYPAPQAGRTPSAVPSATYGTTGTISPILPPNNVTTKDALMEVETATPIPKWIKHDAQWWATDQIGDSDFVSALQYLASQKIIHLTQSAVNNTSPAILPSWVKGLAGSWAEGKISNDYFVITLQSMVNQNIIKISD